VDLPGGQRSGLAEVVDVLRGVEGIQFVQFDDRDVVRHNLVQKIVKAYERYNEALGINRQLSLKLTDPASEVPAAQPVPVTPVPASAESPTSALPNA
jgi:phosphate starvation-inducible PhoH-like protein